MWHPVAQGKGPGEEPKQREDSMPWEITGFLPLGLSWAAVTKYRLGGSNNRHWISTVVEGGSSLSGRQHGGVQVRGLLTVSSHREGPTFMTYSNPNDLPRTPPLNAIPLGDRASTYQFRGDIHILYIARPLGYSHQKWFKINELIFVPSTSDLMTS